MTSNPNHRLEAALELLDYKDDMPSHYRSNLLHAIQFFAALNHDEGLEQACETRLKCIRAENQAARG